MSAEDQFNNEPERIRQDLETGAYFNKAREWYDDIYHRPLAERSFFLIITFFAAITIWLSTQVYLSMYPLSPVIPYIIYSDNVVDEYPVIKPLRWKAGEDLNLALSRFLVMNYVEVRENYKYDVTQMEWNYNRIRSTSGNREFAKYQRFANPQNPASPFTKYGRDARRDISISNVHLNLNQQQQTAQIRYTSTVSRGNERQHNAWLANITFSFPALTVDQETNKVLQWNPEKNGFEEAKELTFKVVDYATQELTQ